MITRFFKRIYRIIDKIIIVPISRAVYYLNKRFKKWQSSIDKVFNKPRFLIYLSLILAVGIFFLIDRKVITLSDTDAEVLTNVKVLVKYNEEAYVVEGVPDTIDITITGRKSDIYLAKQLGDNQVILDLSDYPASDTPRKVYFTYSKSINSLTYKLDPSYVQVTIKNKESQSKSIDYDLLNIDALDSKLSVKSVTLNKSEVVVKGGSDALAEIATVKALIDMEKHAFTDAGTYDIDNVELVAYDSKGNKLDNVEIVPGTIGATVVLESYSATASLQIRPTGSLVAGKAIASVLVNGNSGYSITIYGEKSEIENITSIPVSIDVDGAGNEATKTYTAKITKPAGVRSMSTDTVTITLTFGEEKQKTLDITNSISSENLADGLVVNANKGQTITAQVKGVASAIDEITENSVQAYVDLTGLGAGEHEVEVKIANNNPLVTYVVSSKLKITIKEK